MKKTFAMVLLVGVMAAGAAQSFAQGRNCRRVSDSRTNSSRGSYDNSRGYYDNSRGYYDNSRAYYDYGYRDRSFWDKHRDKLTLAIGGGSGAAVGAMIGGKRGAVIGAASGVGAAALYTYAIRDRRRYRY